MFDPMKLVTHFIPGDGLGIDCIRQGIDRCWEHIYMNKIQICEPRGQEIADVFQCCAYPKPR